MDIKIINHQKRSSRLRTFLQFKLHQAAVNKIQKFAKTVATIFMVVLTKLVLKIENIEFYCVV